MGRQKLYPTEMGLTPTRWVVPAWAAFGKRVQPSLPVLVSHGWKGTWGCCYGREASHLPLLFSLRLLGAQEKRHLLPD